MSKNITKKGNYLNILLRFNKTIFSTKEIALLWNEENSVAVRNRLNDYVKNGKLIRLRRGLYSKDKNYDKFELAVNIYTPSYISFETVLYKAGAIFQYYNSIFVASYLTRDVNVDNQKYSYKKIKDTVLTNQSGIKRNNNYYIASPERAFLDVVYLNKGYHFDNLSPIEWDKVFEILPVYKNKAMEKRVKEYYDNV
jgi:predicted transcriptional regulator of viral defense system